MENAKSNKISQFFSQKKVMVIVSFLGLYLMSTGASWAIFSYLKDEPQIGVAETESVREKIAGLPKTEECPINGEMFTEIERDIWEGRRPIAAMIENHEESRPPSGLSKADIVYEAVAEGGITRFMSIFYCGAAAEDVKIAPVRSARVYHIDWANEYGQQPIFMHVGGANDYAGFGDTVKDARALELLTTLGWRVPGGNDFDTTYDSGFPIFWRNYERLDRQVATEHTMMASLDVAYAQAEKRGFTSEGPEGDKWDKGFVNWDFADGDPASSPEATEISFEFWEDSMFSEQYAVTWKYDEESNSYLRENGGAPHKDLDTGEQLLAKNVAILFMNDRRSVDRNKHILYTTIGEGDALIFQNGDVIEGTWEKVSREARTRFFDDKGGEIDFVRGKIWIEILSKGNEVEY